MWRAGWAGQEVAGEGGSVLCPSGAPAERGVGGWEGLPGRHARTPGFEKQMDFQRKREVLVSRAEELGHGAGRKSNRVATGRVRVNWLPGCSPPGPHGPVGMSHANKTQLPGRQGWHGQGALRPLWTEQSHSTGSGDGGPCESPFVQNGEGDIRTGEKVRPD